MRQGAPHPALDPYRLPENAGCRRDYSKDMCARSLAILSRTVMVATDPRHTQAEIDDIIHDVCVAARVALGGLRPDQARIRHTRPVERKKFDIAEAEGR
jgi:hypothetical protein